MTEVFIDESGNIIPESERDYYEELGYWTLEEKQGEYHEGREQILEEYHYEVVTVYFSDGSIYNPVENDPHIKIIDSKYGLFEYQFLEDEEQNKKVVHFDIKKIIDTPYSPPTLGWYETIYTHIYHLYTPEEIEQREKQEEQRKKQEELLSTGADRLNLLEMDIEDIILTIADITGGEENIEEI